MPEMTSSQIVHRACEASDAIATRRSIRRYQPRPVPRELLIDLLEAATCAPSPHHRQPWRFAVLTEGPDKERLAAAMGDRLRRDRSRDLDDAEVIERDVARSRARICGAPAVILVAVTMADMDRYDDPVRQGAEFLMAVQAVAAAAQNLLLLAHARGLGACWMCAPLFCADTVRAALELPEDWQPQALITVGYPAQSGRDRPSRPLDDSVLWIGGSGKAS